MSKLITLKIKIPVKLTKTSDYQLKMLPVALPSDPLMEHQDPPFLYYPQIVCLCVSHDL